MIDELSEKIEAEYKRQLEWSWKNTAIHCLVKENIYFCSVRKERAGRLRYYPYNWNLDNFMSEGRIGCSVHVLYIHTSSSNVDIGVDCYVYPLLRAVQSLNYGID